MTADENLRLIREIEANRAFLGSPTQAAFNAAAAAPGVRPAGGKIYRPAVRRRRG